MSDQLRQSFHLRLPPGLNEQVREKAEEQDVSVNTMLLLLIAGGVGFKLAPDDKKGRRRS